MKPSILVCAILFAVELVVFGGFAFAQEKDEPWTGKLGDGTIINEEDLKRILSDHAKWLNGEEGGEKANFSDADLQKANFYKANLQKANLYNANLQNAFLRDANLGKANFYKADLQQAILINANLEMADFSYSDLQNASLRDASLEKTDLFNANLQQAILINANLEMADLEYANLHEARLIKAMLQKATLSNADLQKAELNGANLEKANLHHASLQKADLSMAYFLMADLSMADFDGTIFEIRPNMPPEITAIAAAKNLSLLKYNRFPHALFELRNAFKKYGLRKQEREITYAIKHTGFENALKEGNLLTKIEVIFGWLFFEQTCQWGMAPERPLIILLWSILFFMIPYSKAIHRKIDERIKTDGIWRVWIPGRMRDDFGKDNPKELLDSINLWFCIKNGFYFSIHSAFNIGWRDLNVGNWITRMQPYEYRFYASGWARTVSGVQSIISVYLLALAVLTYFGRPFESY